MVFLTLHGVRFPCTGSLSKQAAAASKKLNPSQISPLLAACAHIDTVKQKAAELQRAPGGKSRSE